MLINHWFGSLTPTGTNHRGLLPDLSRQTTGHLSSIKTDSQVNKRVFITDFPIYGL